MVTSHLFSEPIKVINSYNCKIVNCHTISATFRKRILQKNKAIIWRIMA